MDLERNVRIPELYDLHHFHDNELHQGYDYKNNILKRTLSKQLFKNDITNNFLLKLQDMVALMVDSNVILRNWFNHNVTKYYDKHNN